MHPNDKRAAAFKVSSPWSRKWATRYKLSKRRKVNSKINREEKDDADSRRFPRRTEWVEPPARQVHRTQSQRLQNPCGTLPSGDSSWMGASTRPSASWLCPRPGRHVGDSWYRIPVEQVEVRWSARIFPVVPGRESLPWRRPRTTHTRLCIIRPKPGRIGCLA